MLLLRGPMGRFLGCSSLLRLPGRRPPPLFSEFMPLKKVLRQLGVETITGGEGLLDGSLMEAIGSSSEEGLPPHGFPGAEETG